MNDIIQLVNPKTDHYYAFKQHVLSDKFAWYYHETQQPEEYHKGVDTSAKSRFVHPRMNMNRLGDVPMHTHGFLGKPGHLPKLMDVDYIGAAWEVFKEIFYYNKIHVNMCIRIAANQVRPHHHVETTHIHVDHMFDHKNALIYLTDAGGETITENDYHDPKEDDAIIFEGYHTHNVPKSKTRVVLVATYF
tara:strand:+ start:311 stop:880 length:570 start_codon:yes stop_codon:yes gene_type:complete